MHNKTQNTEKQKIIRAQTNLFQLTERHKINLQKHKAPVKCKK